MSMEVKLTLNTKTGEVTLTGPENSNNNSAEDQANPIKVKSASLALKAIENNFVVADLETTGLSASANEIIEFAAIVSDCKGNVIDEFSMLVKPKEQIPEFIVGLTGITQKDVDKNGMTLKDALNKFIKFVKNYPVFFHNAHFDIGFINAACKKYSLEFNNDVYDSLALARKCWPGLPSYKLIELAKIVGTGEPTHRALDDTKATLAVIIGCRDKPVSTVNISVKTTVEHHKFTTKDFVADPNGRFFGKTIVFTGSLVAMTRDGAAQHASKYGFKIGASVTSKTDYLVVGAQDLTHLAGHEKSSKHRKAEDLIKDGFSIEIVTEEDFLEIIEN